MLQALKALSLGRKVGLSVGMILLLLAVAAGAFFFGRSQGTAISKTEIAAYKTSIEKLRAEVSTKVMANNDAVITEYIDRTLTRTKLVVENRDVIREVIVNRDVSVSVTCGWIYAHNQAAADLPIDREKAADTTNCGVVDSKILEQVAENYGIANQNSEQLRSLQQLQRDREAIYATTGSTVK